MATDLDALPTSPSEDDRTLLHELEPEAARLYDRHAKVAQEWFPHDYIPYRLGRDFDKEPWTPDQPRLTGVAQTAFEIGLLTEDNLPSYHRLIHGMFGQGDGAWMSWVGRWTAEEGRHAIVLRDYLTVTRNIDPIALERGRMTQLQQGYDTKSEGLLRGLAYVAFQELATRKYPKLGDVSCRSALTIHRGTEHASPIARPVMVLGVDAPGAGHAELHDMMVTQDYFDALPVLVKQHLVCRVVEELIPVTQKHDIEGLVMGSTPT